MNTTTASVSNPAYGAPAGYHHRRLIRVSQGRRMVVLVPDASRRPSRAGHGDPRTPSHRQRLLETAVSLQLRILIRLYLKKEDFLVHLGRLHFSYFIGGKWFPLTITRFTLRSRSKIDWSWRISILLTRVK